MKKLSLRTDKWSEPRKAVRFKVQECLYLGWDDEGRPDKPFITDFYIVRQGGRWVLVAHTWEEYKYLPQSPVDYLGVWTSAHLRDTKGNVHYKNQFIEGKHE